VSRDDDSNLFFNRPISSEMIIESFAGLHPIIESRDLHDCSKTGRNAQIEISRKVLHIFAGKWTSAI